MTERGYYVTFKETAIVTEYVEAHTGAEAIELVKNGLGDRVGFDIDERRGPTAYSAKREDAR